MNDDAYVNEFTPLNPAAESGQADVVSYILSIQTMPTDNALDAAVKNGHLEVVKKLLPGLNGDPTMYLHDACVYNQVHIVDYLINQQIGNIFHVRKVPNIYFTVMGDALFAAGMYPPKDDAHDMIEYLLAKGLTITRSLNLNESAPLSEQLIVAVEKQNFGLTKYLVENCGAEFNFKVPRMRNIIMKLCKNRKHEVNVDILVRYLIAKGANPNERDRTGQTALFAVVTQKHYGELFAVLLENGAEAKDIQGVSLNVRDEKRSLAQNVY